MNNLEELIKIGLFHTDENGQPLVNKKGYLVPNHSNWANYSIDNFKVITDDGEIYIYDDAKGRYVLGSLMIKGWLENLYPYFSIRDFSEIFEHIRNRTFITQDEKVELAKKTSKLILMRNGLFDIQERVLRPFSPEYFITSQPIPIFYDAKANCPTIKKFITEIVKKDDINLIQEMVGYAFLRDMPIHKAFMFIGEGRNGKSTLINVIVKALGYENVSQISLQQITQGGFVISHLKDKLANVYPDLPARALNDTGIFKVLTGGDWITTDRKFKSPISFMNYAKFIFSCNKLPEARDDTKAFYRRWVLINFPNEFPPDKADPDLLSKLTTDSELSGFFNWAMEGLYRLLSNGRFSHSKTTEEVKEQYERLSNSLLAFVKDCLEVDQNGTVTKSELFSAYAEYCRQYNLPVKSKTSVGRELAEHIPVTSSNRGKERTWVGVRIVANKDKEVLNMGEYNEMKQAIDWFSQTDDSDPFGLTEWDRKVIQKAGELGAKKMDDILNKIKGRD